MYSEACRMLASIGHVNSLSRIAGNARRCPTSYPSLVMCKHALLGVVVIYMRNYHASSHAPFAIPSFAFPSVTKTPRHANNSVTITRTARRRLRTTGFPFGVGSAISSMYYWNSASVGLCLLFCIFLKNDVPHHPLVEEV